MVNNLSSIIEAAMALDRDSKMLLAERIVSDLSEHSEHVSLWLEESKDRLEAFRRGEITATPAKEAIENSRRRFSH